VPAEEEGEELLLETELHLGKQLLLKQMNLWEDEVALESKYLNKKKKNGRKEEEERRLLNRT